MRSRPWTSGSRASKPAATHGWRKNTLKFRIERFGDIAHLWSSYGLHSDGKQVARGINSVEAVKETGGWRVTSIVVQAESATMPLPKRFLP
jgi:hypothetical protein